MPQAKVTKSQATKALREAAQAGVIDAYRIYDRPGLSGFIVLHGKRTGVAGFPISKPASVVRFLKSKGAKR